VQNLQAAMELFIAGPMSSDPTQPPGYGLVMFDTPPALLSSDPVLLAEHLYGLMRRQLRSRKGRRTQ